MGADPQAAGLGLQGQQWEVEGGHWAITGHPAFCPTLTQAGTEDKGPRFQT